MAAAAGVVDDRLGSNDGPGINHQGYPVKEDSEKTRFKLTSPMPKLLAEPEQRGNDEPANRGTGIWPLNVLRN